MARSMAARERLGAEKPVRPETFQSGPHSRTAEAFPWQGIHFRIRDAPGHRMAVGFTGATNDGYTKPDRRPTLANIRGSKRAFESRTFESGCLATGPNARADVCRPTDRGAGEAGGSGVRRASRRDPKPRESSRTPLVLGDAAIPRGRRLFPKQAAPGGSTREGAMPPDPAFARMAACRRAPKSRCFPPLPRTRRGSRAARASGIRNGG